MSFSSAISSTKSSISLNEGTPRKTPSEASHVTFKSLVANQSSNPPFTRLQAKEFFAGSPSHAQIASKAASLKLTKEQIVEAMQTSGYGKTGAVSLGNSVEKFVAESNSQFSWNRNGELTEVAAKVNASSAAPSEDYHFVQELMAQNAAAAKNTDRISTGFGMGPTVTVEQARNFFASNPDDNTILKMAAKLHMSDEELSSALVYGRGDTYNNLTTFTMINNSDQYGFDSVGHIVALNGNAKHAQNGNSMLVADSAVSNKSPHVIG
jgi:hypothetical protein